MKCSRQMPCSQCVKNGLSCMYDKEKGKPGMKAGAIDRINHCLDARGNMSLGQGVVWQQLWNQFHATINAVPPPMTGSLHEHTERLKQRLNTLGRKRCSDEDDIMISSELKKRRNIDRGANNTERTTIDRDIPGQEMLLGDLTDFLVELYFSNIHPWIPVLHIRQFRRPLHLPDEKRKINMILHTTSVCVHFSDDPRFGRCKVAQSWRILFFNRPEFKVQSCFRLKASKLSSYVPSIR